MPEFMKSAPMPNLLIIMIISLIFSFLSLHVAGKVSGVPEMVFSGESGLLVLIVTSLITHGSTDKMVPMSTHLRLMDAVPGFPDAGYRFIPPDGRSGDYSGGLQASARSPVLRLNLLVGFSALCLVAIYLLWKTDISPMAVIPVVFSTAIFLAKKLADPDANDKEVPEEVTFAVIDDLEDRIQHFQRCVVDTPATRSGEARPG